MGKNKQKEQSQEQVEEYEEYDEQDDFDVADDYISRDQLMEELKSRISSVEGDKKIAFAGLFEIYGKQEALNDEEDKEIQQIKHKYRMKAENLLNKTRKIVSGQSTQNDIISNSEFLSETQKSKGLKNIQVPEFWPTVIKNSSFETLIDKQELPAIDSIKNIFVKKDNSTKQISVEIHFGDNSIFTDKVLKASLIETSQDEIKHTYDSPKYKPHYVRPEYGFFNIFSQIPNEELTGLYQYWLNFYQQQLPQALAFYFQLRQGTFHPKVPSFMQDDEGLEEEDEQEEEQAKPKKKKQIQKPQKPECKQQ